MNFCDATSSQKGEVVPRVIVIVPTYNEGENLPKLVASLFQLVIPRLHVLIIDDNSPDGTGQVAEVLAKEYREMSVIHRSAKLGLGTAYVLGFMHALEQGYDYVVQMDADFSHNPSYLPTFLHALMKDTEVDFIVGSRYIRGGTLDTHWGLERRLLSKWGSIYSRAILGLKVKDSTAGFKMFRATVLETLPLASLHSTGYCFQLEIAYLCQRYGLQALEIPIHFQERLSGVSKMSFRISFEAAWKTWLIRNTWRDVEASAQNRQPITVGSQRTSTFLPEDKM